ncbi:MAG: FAD-dependent oxidoreductase [Myxococcales bacterium]|nr:FAD-dependent oxidoreductase [Myxococcales bacterium]
MAVVREARVADVVDLTPTTRILELEPVTRLDFVGGQYVIVNSGITLPDGKLAKRAYSFLSADERQERVVVAVRKMGGAASHWMHTRVVGDVIPFSGPWGKWLAEDSQPRRTLVMATDTGITAALGLIRGRAFAPQLARAELVWLVQDRFDASRCRRSRIPSG